MQYPYSRPLATVLVGSMERIYEQVTQLEGGCFGRDRRPDLERRMRERVGDGKGADPPFTVAPRWAQDHIIHVHSITYLTKTKQKPPTV